VKKISRVNVVSVLKISAALGAVAGLLVGAILLVVNLIDKRFLEGAVSLVMAPLLYALIGAGVNALMAWIYNLAAGKLGGIEVQLDD